MVSDVSIIPANPSPSWDTPNYTRSLHRAPRDSNSSSTTPSFICTAVISYPNPSSNTSELESALSAVNSSSSWLVIYFSKLHATIVSVNYTITNSQELVTTTAATITTTSIGSLPPKSDLSIAVPVGIVVPSVIILGAAGGFAFVKYRRNRNAAHRARHWDMHNMYSGLSMVDYA